MKRIVKRRTEITIETYEITVRRQSTDVVAYWQNADPEEPPIAARITSESDGEACGPDESEEIQGGS